ncbi:MAG TPA: Ig-like domain-containing protein [Cyclobacteriaceae bacterium]
MKQRIVHYCIALFLLITIWKCASISTPQGGPKDKKPPILLKSSPEQGQKNFKKESVELTFNEALKLNNPKEEIIIIPTPGKEISFTVKGSLAIIKPKEGWKDSTTYSISFREGIQDITEGNPAKDLRLAFSTGPIIDSLVIKGSLREAFTEKIPENITIALYSSDTFNIFKHNPSYFTKSNKLGNFQLENLKANTYFIYAFDDKNKNLKVDSPGEQFGFLKDSIHLTKNVSGLTIPTFKIDTRKLKLTSGRSLQDLATIKFNKNIITYKLIEEDSTLKLHHSFGENQTEIALLLNQYVTDSTRIRVLAEDSLLQKVDTSFYVKRTPAKRTHDPLKIAFGDLELNSQTGLLTTKFQSNKIITSFRFDSINLRLDSAIYMKLAPSEITFDTLTKKGILTKKLEKKDINLERKELIRLELGKDFACSIEDDSIKAQKISAKVLTFEETGLFHVEVNNRTSYDFILELLTQDNKVVRSAINQKKYSFDNLTPGIYKLRIIIDKNCNGKWDYGNILLREEPETIIYYRSPEKKYEIPIRENWEVGPYKISI